MGTDTEVHKESATLRFSEGTTSTIRDPSLHCNENVYTFHNPAISIRPRLTGHHQLLTPPPSPPPRVHSNPPPPRGHTAGGWNTGGVIGSLLHRELYRLPDEPHSLNPDYLKEWGCAAALALLQTSSLDTTLVHQDGSAGVLGYGAAASLFFPSGTRWILCQTAPYQSSEGSEFWTAIMFL